MKTWKIAAWLIPVAIGVLHLLNGATQPAWAPYVPGLQTGLGMSLTVLGLALLGQPAGLVIGGSVGGFLIDRLGARRMLIAGTIGYWGPLTMVGFSDGPVALFCWLFAVGVGNGLFDVGWGVQSTAFEYGKTKRHHVGIQVWNSGGAIVGASAGASAVANDMSLGLFLALFCSVALLVAVSAAAVVLPDIRGRSAYSDADDVRVLHGDQADRNPLRSPLLWALAGICLAGGLGGGAVLVWSTPFLQSLGAPEGIAATGLIASLVAQALGQVTGWLIPGRVARPWVLVTTGAVLACGGWMLIVGTARFGPAVAGFALIGFGLAFTWPLAQSVAGEHFAAGGRGRAMSMVIVGMYFGMLGAPPLIGVVGDWLGLRTALGLMIPCCAGIALLALIFMRPLARVASDPQSSAAGVGAHAAAVPPEGQLGQHGGGRHRAASTAGDDLAAVVAELDAVAAQLAGAPAGSAAVEALARARRALDAAELIGARVAETEGQVRLLDAQLETFRRDMEDLLDAARGHAAEARRLQLVHQVETWIAAAVDELNLQWLWGAVVEVEFDDDQAIVNIVVWSTPSAEASRMVSGLIARDIARESEGESLAVTFDRFTTTGRATAKPGREAHRRADSAAANDLATVVAELDAVAARLVGAPAGSAEIEALARAESACHAALGIDARLREIEAGLESHEALLELLRRDMEDQLENARRHGVDALREELERQVQTWIAAAIDELGLDWLQGAVVEVEPDDRAVAVKILDRSVPLVEDFWIRFLARDLRREWGESLTVRLDRATTTGRAMAGRTH